MKHSLETFTVRSLLEQSADRHADRLALSLYGDDSEQYTYTSLKESVDRVASYLLSRKVEKGDRIAILAESSPMWGIAYLAIVSAGCIAVPVLPEFSSKEVDLILTHSGTKKLFAAARQAEKIPKSFFGEDHEIYRIDDLFHVPSDSDTSRVGREEFLDLPAKNMRRKKADEKALKHISHEEDALVSIIYTSGTTGNPKGVMLSNRNLTSNAAASVRQFFKVKSGMKFLSILPMSHSYEFTIGFLLPLLCGCEVHYLGRPPVASILLPALKQIRPDMMLSVPLLIEKIYRGSVVPQIEGSKNLSSMYHHRILRREINRIIGRRLKMTFGGRLKFFGVGGAKLDREVESFLKEARFPYAIGYGLTETSPLLAGSGPAQTKVGTIGYPLKTVEVRIDSPDPHTGVGEIVAKGPNVMLGYYEAPEMTKETFTSDGWIKTGDLGEIVRGRLSIKGRSKTMILGPGGENIYPESIEALINAKPYVQESLVMEGEGGIGALIKVDLELMAEQMKMSVEDAKSEAASYVHNLRQEINRELNSFSRLIETKLHEEPFQRTPTLKIKRYLYSLTHRNQGEDKKKDEEDKRG